MDLSKLATERRNPNTMNIDAMSALEIVTTINREDALVADVIRPALPVIADLVEAIVAAFDAGGRLIYVGAGTSGRLGVLDSVELLPTFGWPRERAPALLAGGDGALRHSVEGAEDDEELGARDVDALAVTARDVVVGIAASGRTPYTVAAMRRAKVLGAPVGCIVNSPDSPMAAAADFPIVVVVGAEVVTGSTRMKSGTAQKLVLNMLSTAVMARLGLAWRGEMVAMRPTNAKLRRRAIDMMGRLLALPPGRAEGLLVESGWDLPVALAAGRWGLPAARAREWIASRSGNVARALEEGPT